MRTTTITGLVTLLSMTLALSTGIVACTGEASDDDTNNTGAATLPAGHVPADASLKAIGVHSIQATGSAENATITFFDENANVIGGGRFKSSEEQTLTEVGWKGVVWEVETGSEGADVDTSDEDAIVKKDGTVVKLDGEAKKQVEEAHAVLTASLKVAELPSATASAQRGRCKGRNGICFFTRCCAGYQCVATSWGRQQCKRR